MSDVKHTNPPSLDQAVARLIQLAKILHEDITGSVEIIALEPTATRHHEANSAYSKPQPEDSWRVVVRDCDRVVLEACGETIAHAVLGVQDSAVQAIRRRYDKSMRAALDLSECVREITGEPLGGELAAFVKGATQS